MTLVDIKTIYANGIYTDLIRMFDANGHNMYVISPVERRRGGKTHVIRQNNTTILKLRIGNTQKTNVIEKGINTVLIEPLFKWGVRKHFADVKFDLVLYSTPPITLVSTIEYVKKRDNAKTYLLLKDIFPQNAVDIDMLSTTGVKGLLYRRFREQEKKLYAISDRIGCMSQANADYVIKHNPAVNPNKVEICPNSIEVNDKSVDTEMRKRIREKYGIIENRKVFVYGGNLGKPQGIPFLIECLRECESIADAFFLIIGDGTEFHLLEKYVKDEKPKHVKLMKRISKEDYDTMVGACDVGLIFLDHRFTIPNFPSRLLSYMAAKLPVLACTDPNTDVGKVIVEGDFGWWCESNDAEAFSRIVKNVCNRDVEKLGDAGYNYLIEHYSVKECYSIICHGIGG